jgi:RES domain-containing protein
LSITAWRIVKQKHTRAAFTGEGARRYGGRWNSKGVPIVYVAQSQSLAALEMLVHLDSGELLKYYVAIPVTFEEHLVSHLDSSSLPKNWKAYPAPNRLHTIGDAWASARKSVVLRIPSVIVPSESNFLLNPAHPDFDKLAIGEPLRFRFDPRLISES